MSNQEAIALLRNLEDSLDSYCELSEEGKTAFRMAIEALSCSEFPNSSDTDTISRQAAIDALRVAYFDNNIQSAKDDPCIVDAMTDWAIRQVKALPPAQPEIIQCKDCKYAEYMDDVQSLWCTECGNGRTVAPYDFCSYGEVRAV